MRTPQVPTWVRVAEEALASHSVQLLRCEAWVLATVAELIGASRLAAQVGEQIACPQRVAMCVCHLL